MEFVVSTALVLLFASFVYTPLGRALRQMGSKPSPHRNASGAFPTPPDPAAPAPAAPAAEPPAVLVAAVAAVAPPQFGRRKTIEEPKRRAEPPAGQIFNKELFEGKMGDFLRQHGYAPDDPRNQAVNTQPLAVLLAEDAAGLRRATEALNGAAPFRIEPWHLLPLEAWREGFGRWLRQGLDLSPFRPWNTIFLPADETGAKALGLPVAPPQPEGVSDQLRAMLSILHEVFAGQQPPEAEAVKMMLAAVRENAPQLFPPDIGDFSDRVREARADVRALAFATAGSGGVLAGEAIIKSQATFLGAPHEQLVA